MVEDVKSIFVNGSFLNENFEYDKHPQVRIRLHHHFISFL